MLTRYTFDIRIQRNLSITVTQGDTRIVCMCARGSEQHSVKINFMS